MEAPRYRRVGPAGGQPQRLVITKDVSGYLALPMGGGISLWWQSKIHLIPMNVCAVGRQQQCDRTLWQQC